MFARLPIWESAHLELVSYLRTVRSNNRVRGRRTVGSAGSSDLGHEAGAPVAVVVAGFLFGVNSYDGAGPRRETRRPGRMGPLSHAAHDAAAAAGAGGSVSAASIAGRGSGSRRDMGWSWWCGSQIRRGRHQVGFPLHGVQKE